MENPRFFVDSENQDSDSITISGEEFIHLNSVLRLKPADEIEVCIGDGMVQKCVLVEVGKRQAIAKVLGKVKQKPILPHVTLFLALTKSERMDWAVQKCVELGVYRIVPFESKYCTVMDKGNKTDRLNRIAIAACKQSGLAYLPKIENTVSFEKLLSMVKDNPQTIVAYERATQNAKDVLLKLASDKEVAIIIGSEGGFSLDEVEALKNAGAKVISLGETILRVETACVALLSAIMYEMNNWERT